jgi:hypothetical protein
MAMNMSYCRFENTYKAWTECLEALRAGDVDRASEREYAKRLLADVLDYCRDHNIIDEGYDLLWLECMVDKMGVQCEGEED